MIKSKKDLKEYLLADKTNLGFKRRDYPIIGKEIWKFQISLRYLEYYTNTKNIPGGRIMRMIWEFVNHQYSIKLGFTIPVNTFGKGLNIHHYGCIVVNDHARIGENCNIQQCVNIGQNYGAENVPVIGNNVYIGPGAKLFGKITIADGCVIGAGAVVTKSFEIPNTVIVGNPGKAIGVRKEGIT